MFKTGILSCVVGVLSVTATTAVSETVIITDLLPSTPTPAADAWYLSDMRGAGTANIVDLTGVGGNLELNQPLPTGAVRVTTGADNNDKAEIGTFGNLGNAATVLTSGTVGYSYYKQDVVGGNVSAAPSIKLTLFASGGTGDNFGTLVYEPTWNQPTGGSAPSPTDAWQDVVINSTAGAGSTATGGWWWTGGFGESNTAGGPPVRSLSEWAALFLANDPTDFPSAQVVGLSVGVGTFNLEQIGYFDKVSIKVPGGIDKVYDFEVPEPASIGLLGLGALALAGRRRG